MLQNPCKTLGIMKNMVHEIPPGGGGGGKPYPASGLFVLSPEFLLYYFESSLVNCILDCIITRARPYPKP